MDAREVRLRGDGVWLRGLEWAGRPPPGRERDRRPPPVVLLHATSFCADVWGPVWAAAAPACGAHRAIAVDQRGHGGSDAPPGPSAYAWTRLAGDLVALARDLAGGASGGVILGGHSSGGAAALAAAGLAPELVRGVIVVEPVLFERPAPPDAFAERPLHGDAGAEPPPQHGDAGRAPPATDSFAGSRLLASRARRRRAVFPSREVARAALCARPPYRGFAPAALDAYLDGGLATRPDGSVVLRCAPETEGAAYDGAAALDLWPLAERIEAPVRVLAADRSAIPAAALDRLRAAQPELRVETIAGATHFAALEQPEAVGRAIGRLVSELSGRPGKPAASAGLDLPRWRDG